MTTDIDAVLIRALADNNLATAAADLVSAGGATPPRRAVEALAACEALGTVALSAQGELARALGATGIEVTVGAPPSRDQVARFELRFQPADAAAAVATAQAEGYHPMHLLGDRALPSYLRIQSHIEMVRASDPAVRATLRWRPPRPARLPSLRPTAADFAAVDFPPLLWPLYYPFRMLRIGLQRIGWMTQPPQLGSFIPTPSELLPSLFDVAELSGDDLLVDIGCGEGRVLVTAAASTGCRAVGYEMRPQLLAAARDNADAAGVGSSVEIRGDDAVTVALPPATVAFVFLPAAGLQRVLPRLLTELPTGARIVAHEQMALDPPIPPSEVKLLIGSAAVTTASVWRAR